MTPEQALQILDQATAKLAVDRQTQLAIMQALKTMQDLIKPVKPLRTATSGEG